MLPCPGPTEQLQVRTNGQIVHKPRQRPVPWPGFKLPSNAVGACAVWYNAGGHVLQAYQVVCPGHEWAGCFGSSTAIVVITATGKPKKKVYYARNTRLRPLTTLLHSG